MESFSFGQPLWFWAFPVLPLFLLLFVRNEMLRARLLRRLVAARLLDRLAGTASPGRRRLRFALLLLAMSAIILSLTQPRYGYRWEESKRRGRDVLIAVDVSKSMLATDATPNRLTRAKLAAQDLLRQLGGDRVGLVAFAGRAFLQAPLTADFNAVLTSVQELEPDIIPLGGSNIAEAIKVSVEAFGKGESEHRALIIFTDGEELDADAVKAAQAAKDGVRIFGVGIGTAEGSLIPQPGRGAEFVRDDKGNFVKTRLDETRLRTIAELTGGFYVHLLSGPAEMTQIVREGLAKMSEKEIDAKLSRQPIERYQWPLAAGLLLLVGSALFGERRPRARAATGVAVAAKLLLATMLWPTGAEAASGLELYQAGKYEEAQREWQRRVEKNPASGPLAFNLGAAAYRNKDFDTALRAFSQALASGDESLRARSEYNLGNTLFQKGAAKLDLKTLEDALGHFNQSLAQEPGNADAQHNKKVTEELIEKLKQKQQEQQPQQQQSGDQQQKDQQEQKKEEQQKQQQSKSEQGKDQSQEQQPQQGAQKQEQPQDGKNEEQKASPQNSGQEGKPEQQPGQKGEPSKNEGQPKEAQNSPGQDGEEKGNPQPQQASQGQGGKQDGKPGEAPAQENRNLSGEVKANQGQQPPGAKEGSETAEMSAAEQGTPEKQEKVDARALLESLKHEEERVRLLDPRDRKRSGPPLRDW